MQPQQHQWDSLANAGLAPIENLSEFSVLANGSKGRKVAQKEIAAPGAAGAAIKSHRREGAVEAPKIYPSTAPDATLLCVPASLAKAIGRMIGKGWAWEDLEARLTDAPPRVDAPALDLVRFVLTHSRLLVGSELMFVIGCRNQLIMPRPKALTAAQEARLHRVFVRVDAGVRHGL